MCKWQIKFRAMHFVIKKEIKNENDSISYIY